MLVCRSNCFELWASFRRSRTMTLCLSSNCFELCARFRRSRTLTPCLSSNYFEPWVRFRRSAFCRMNRSGGKAHGRGLRMLV